MGRLIPLILKPFIFPSSAENSNIIPPLSLPAPPIPVKSNRRPQPEARIKFPYTILEWRDFLDEVKSLYSKGQYKQCSNLCARVIEDVRGPVHLVQLVYVSFYAASSIELIARSLPLNDFEKIPTFTKSRAYYWHANSLMSQAVREQSASVDCKTSKSYKHTIPRMWARRTSINSWNTVSSKSSVSSDTRSSLRPLTLSFRSSSASSRGSFSSFSNSHSPSSSTSVSSSGSPRSARSVSDSNGFDSRELLSSSSSSVSTTHVKRHSGYMLVRRRSKVGKQSQEFSPSLPTVISVGDIRYASSPFELEECLSAIDDTPIPIHLPSFCNLTSKSSASGSSDVFTTRRRRPSSSTPSSGRTTPRVATHSESLAAYLHAIRRTGSTTSHNPLTPSSPRVRYIADLNILSTLISQHIKSVNLQINTVKAARNNRLSYRSAFHRDLATVNNLLDLSREDSMSSLNVEVGIIVTQHEAKAAKWRMRTEELKARGEERKKNGSWDGTRYRQLCEVVLSEIEGSNVDDVDEGQVGPLVWT